MKDKDLDLMVTCALRYALPRSSYIVGSVCETIENNLAELSREAKRLMLEDIDRELNDRSLGYGMNFECDEVAIKRLRAKVAESL